MTATTITDLKAAVDLGEAQVGDYFPGNRVAGVTGAITWAPKLIQDPSPTMAANITLNGFDITGVGRFQGTPVQLAYGGMNAALTASNGGIFYSTATAGAILSGTATAHKMLLSGSTAAPTWSTSTIPTSSGTAGQILVSDGTNYVLSTPTFPNASATSLKYIRSDGTNWITSSSTLPDSYAQGDILYSSASNVMTALAKDTVGVKFLSNQGTSNNPSWSYVPVAGGGTGVQSTTAYAVLCGGTTSTGALQSIASVGSSGQVLTSNGAGALPTFQSSPSSKLVQRVYVRTSAVATGTTQIPWDNTTPQNTEGDQFMSLAITPTNSSNLLRIYVNINLYKSAAAFAQTTALFQDSTANALCSVYTLDPDAASASTQNFIYEMTAGTTSATTFKVRSGPSGASTTTFNGQGGTGLFNSTMASTMIIEEIIP